MVLVTLLHERRDIIMTILLPHLLVETMAAPHLLQETITRHLKGLPATLKITDLVHPHPQERTTKTNLLHTLPVVVTMHLLVMIVLKGEQRLLIGTLHTRRQTLGHAHLQEFHQRVAAMSMIDRRPGFSMFSIFVIARFNHLLQGLYNAFY